MRPSSAVAFFVASLQIALLVLEGLLVRAGGSSGSGQTLTFSIAVGTFTLLGALIVWKRPRNAIGWIFAAVGLLWVTGELASAYARYAFETRSAGDALSTLAAWYGEWYWPLWLVAMFSLVPMLFPTGRPLLGRWRIVFRLVVVFVSSFSVLAMFEDRLDIWGTGHYVTNPVGIRGLHDIESGPVAVILFPGLMLCLVAGLSALVARFKRSRGEERQQLKWFVFAAATLIVEFVSQIVLDATIGVRLTFVDALVAPLVPLSAAIAILRYRLYDIDLVINKTLVYATLTAILGVAYVGIVFSLQSALAPFTQESDIAIAASTLAVAGLFRPVRGRVQGFIDRRFYRRRFDVQRTLELFSTSLRDEVDLESMSAQLVTVVGDTMQPSHISLWLREVPSGAGR